MPVFTHFHPETGRTTLFPSSSPLDGCLRCLLKHEYWKGTSHRTSSRVHPCIIVHSLNLSAIVCTHLILKRMLPFSLTWLPSLNCYRTRLGSHLAISTFKSCSATSPCFRYRRFCQWFIQKSPLAADKIIVQTYCFFSLKKDIWISERFDTIRSSSRIIPHSLLTRIPFIPISRR